MNKFGWSLMIIVLCLSACSLAPQYKRPELTLPSHYKESGQWVEVKPYPFLINPKHPWWTLFGDKTLNALEQRVTCDNQTLKISLARYDEARAIALAVRSEKYPKITGLGTVAREQRSASIGVGTTPSLLYNTFMLSAYLNYEVDAWGSVRNAVIASESLARASRFDRATISLTLHAELASDYFKIRSIDESQRILDTIVDAYQQALYLTQQRHHWGIVPVIDVDQAITQLENAKTMATELRLKRAQLEHAIAVLIGDVPGAFTLQPKKQSMRPVVLPPSIPSMLLEHRPDIAAAEQRVAAANAGIGVARAAFFPRFNLINLLGYQSTKLSQLFTAPNLFWSIGPSTALTLVQPEISQVLFDGFKLIAQLKYAKASYFEAVSHYRQTALTAFKEVEDALVAIHRLEEENTSKALSTQAAKRAWHQANQRYQGGIATFLEVVVVENEALNDELALISIRTRRQLSYVQLIKALGGGWGHCCKS